MKNTIDTIKSLINRMGFLPEDGVSNIYFKKYVMHSNYIIRVNFNTSKIEYRENDVSEEDGIKCGDLTTSNFENSENFVVLECINRLLEKGYAPKNLYLEYKFPLGRNEKGKLDILVFDNDGKAYLMIECKTWGNIKNLNDSDVDIKIPIPPTKVQEKIINEIELVETEENSKIVKHANLRGKLKKAEWFSYDLERLEKLTNMVQRGKSAKYGTSSIQIIKSGQARGYNNFDFSKRYYVSDSFISDERNLQKGDILINSTGVGTAGRVTLFDLDGDFVVDSHITIVRLNQEKVLPKYVLYALANIGFKNIEAMATGQSGQIELALPTVNSIRIPLPDIKTQKDIVSEIEEIEKEMNILEREISEMEEQKNKILANHLK